MRNKRGSPWARSVFALGAMAAVLGVNSSQAAVTEIVPPGTTWVMTEGLDFGDRSIIVDSLETIPLQSVGIFLDRLANPPAFGLNLALRTVLAGAGSTGTPNALVASTSANFVDLGPGYYEVPISVTLNAGTRYEIAIEPVDGYGATIPGISDSLYSVAMTQFDPVLQGYTQPVIGGLFRLIDGGASSQAGYSNTLLPRFRLTSSGSGTTPLSLPDPFGMVLAGLLSIVIGHAFKRPPANPVRRHTFQSTQPE